MVKKVAVVTESFLPQVNGVTGSVVRVLETFKQREIDALVIAPTSPSSKHLGFDVHTTVSLPVLQFPVAFPGPSISRALDSFEPDVVHVAAPFMLGAQAIAWANRRGVPSVAIYQTDVAG
ncbi:MAG: glycosyltransferase family 1 protein, partial [Actinobacteria bacterium]|nr:glycosyltransferase family 1 protein [Actinomycetota bacterium]